MRTLIVFVLPCSIVAPLGCDANDVLTSERNETNKDCTAAVAKLVDCCPGFDASKIDCTRTYVCGPGPCEFRRWTAEAIRWEDARCIETSSCDTVVRSGMCAAAQDAKRAEVFKEGEKEYGPTLDCRGRTEEAASTTDADAG